MTGRSSAPLPTPPNKMASRASRSIQRRVKVRRRLLVERLDQRRVLAAITGAVFDDLNLSFQREVGEAGAPQRLIFIDGNDNASFEAGERFVLADADGKFEFPGLTDGSYKLRLFNGTASQTQTVPVEATIESATVAILDAIQLEQRSGATLALTANSVVVADLQSGSSDTLPVGGQLTKMQSLPNGNLLVIGTDISNPNPSGATAWEVNPAAQTVTAVNLAETAQPTTWSDLAIDGNGRGVLLEPTLAGGDAAEAMVGIRGIDASADSNIVVTDVLQQIPADAQVIASDTGNRTVFAWSGNGNDGLQLSLWSNVTSSFITPDPVDSLATTELLAFDDAAGLLAVRTESGGVSVYDVDANFAALHTLDDVTGPIAIDGERDLLITVSPVDTMLKLINLRDGSLVADLAIDLSSIGQVSSLALGDRLDAVTVIGAAGVTEVALRKAAAREVTISNGQDPDPVLFGVSLSGVNTAPSYATQPTFQTDEDDSISLGAPAALQGSSDLEGDRYVILQLGQPQNGTAIVSPEGAFQYSPDSNFNGIDSVPVLLHDGRDLSSQVSLAITVDAIPDAPTAIEITLAPFGENAIPGIRVGDFEIIDADGIDGVPHVIELSDARFQFRNGQIIFVGGEIDYESEPLFPLDVTVTDTETSTVLHKALTVTILDENDPITAIRPRQASLFENDLGAFVADLEIDDQDPEDVHTVTVDDNRFVVGDDLRLKLKEGVAVDYEVEPTITVNVTAKDGGGDSFTQSVRIEVFNVLEQPQSIELSNETVMELVPGAKVGDITLDGQTPDSRFSLTVDDARFEIVGNTLKLLDGQIVQVANQDEIELTLFAEDQLGEFAAISNAFVIDVLKNATPYHNQDNPYDVDHNGNVTALDALTIINYLNTYGPGPVGPQALGLCYDVNADDMITALDALLVLNELNRVPAATTVGNGEKTGAEGEQVQGNTPLPARDSEPGNVNQDRLGGESVDAVLEGGVNASLDSGTVSTAAIFTDTTGSPSVSDSIENLNRSASDKFAENVDATLRLLSDDDS